MPHLHIFWVTQRRKTEDIVTANWIILAQANWKISTSSYAIQEETCIIISCRNLYFNSIVILYFINITYCSPFHQNGLHSHHNCHTHSAEECNFHYCTWILQLYKVLGLVLYLQLRRETLRCHGSSYAVPTDSTTNSTLLMRKLKEYGKITTRVTLEVCSKAKTITSALWLLEHPHELKEAPSFHNERR